MSSKKLCTNTFVENSLGNKQTRVEIDSPSINTIRTEYLGHGKRLRMNYTTRIKMNYNDSSENNTICSSNHLQILYLSTFFNSCYFIFAFHLVPRAHEQLVHPIKGPY